MTVAIIANGEILSYPETKLLITPYKKVVAVDGGLNHCHKMNIIPDLIIGDMDSVDPDLLSKYPNIELIKLPCEKDESDLEVAIAEMIQQGHEEITIFGALGKRTDHMLYTLHLLTRYPSVVKIRTESEILFSLERQNEIACRPGQTISLIPMGVVKNVTTQGLKWELHQAEFNKNWMSLSNICLGDSFTVSSDSGDLICTLELSL